MVQMQRARLGARANGIETYNFCYGADVAKKLLIAAGGIETYNFCYCADIARSCVLGEIRI